MLDGQNKDSERAGIEEQYTSATHTSNLKMEARVRGPGDVIIAAGWSRSRIGSALLRLHSEWDGAEKPPRPTPAQIEAISASFPKEKNGLVRLKTKDAAGNDTVLELKPADAGQRVAREWYFHELGMLFQKLKTLSTVRHQLLLWAIREEVEDGWWDEVFFTRQDKIAHVIAWWLDATCRTCDGQKWKMIPGTPHLSNRLCEDCHGAGKAVLPAGPDGKKIHTFVKDCTAATRADMNGRFQHQKMKEKP